MSEFHYITVPFDGATHFLRLDFQRFVPEEHVLPLSELQTGAINAFVEVKPEFIDEHHAYMIMARTHTQVNTNMVLFLETHYLRHLPEQSADNRIPLDLRYVNLGYSSVPRKIEGTKRFHAPMGAVEELQEEGGVRLFVPKSMVISDKRAFLVQEQHVYIKDQSSQGHYHVND